MLRTLSAVDLFQRLLKAEFAAQFQFLTLNLKIKSPLPYVEPLQGYNSAYGRVLGFDRKPFTIVPMHFSKTVPKGTLHAIIKQAGLTAERFLRFSER